MYTFQPTAKMPTRAKDWFEQALNDVEHAKESQASGRHEWACFASQQSAEKAVKALHLHLGQDAWGHVVAQLLRDLPIDVPALLIEAGRVLDNFYIPTRYPNSHPQGAPFEHYGPLQSQEALRRAQDVIEFVSQRM